MVCPAVVAVGCSLKSSLAGAPSLTWNELLIPVAGLSVAVMVMTVPVLVMVTLWLVRTPLVNAGVVTGAPTSAPVEVSFTLNPLPLYRSPCCYPRPEQ